MSKNNTKENPSENQNRIKNPKTDYPISRDPKHNKQEPTKGLPQI